MYELTVFVLTVTRENHSLAFVFFILYRFQGSSRQPRVALALTAQLLYRVIRRLSTPFSHFFALSVLFISSFPSAYPHSPVRIGCIGDSHAEKTISGGCTAPAVHAARLCAGAARFRPRALWRQNRQARFAAHRSVHAGQRSRLRVL